MIKMFLHISLALSVLLSTSGLWVYDHYCKNEYIQSSYFLNIKGCCDGKDTSNCKADKFECSSNNNEEKDDCCQNKLKYFKSDQEQFKQDVLFSQTNKKSQHWSFDTFSSCVETISFLNSSKENFHYVPPSIIFNRQIHLQTFLC